jgi:hypothetical protein
LLELVLIDSLAVLDPRRVRAAEQVIERCIPRQCYENVMERYDRLSGDSLRGDCPSGASDTADVLTVWLPRAARRDSGWKSRMVLHFLDIVRVDGRIPDSGLADVAALACGMGAGRECRRLFCLAFGFDPFARPFGAPFGAASALMSARSTVGRAGR